MSGVFDIKLNDACNPEAMPKHVEIRYTKRGIAISFDGYGDATTNGNGEPVYIELRDGVPFVCVWADIQREDPTHVLTLEDASLDRQLSV